MKLNQFKSLDAALAYVFTELLYSLEEELSAMEGVASTFHSDEERREKAAAIDDIRRVEPLITHAYTLFEAANAAIARLERGDREAAQRALRRAVYQAAPNEH